MYLTITLSYLSTNLGSPGEVVGLEVIEPLFLALEEVVALAVVEPLLGAPACLAVVEPLPGAPGEEVLWALGEVIGREIAITWWGS